MKKLQKDKKTKHILIEFLAMLKEGTVIVEGKHDYNTLNKLGINSITEKKVGKSASIPKSSTIYILTDNDRRGFEKQERLFDELLYIDKEFKINTTLGRRLLKLLNCTSVEQIFAPVNEILELGEYKWQRHI